MDSFWIGFISGVCCTFAFSMAFGVVDDLVSFQVEGFMNKIKLTELIADLRRITDDLVLHGKERYHPDGLRLDEIAEIVNARNYEDDLH